MNKDFQINESGNIKLKKDYYNLDGTIFAHKGEIFEVDAFRLLQKYVNTGMLLDELVNSNDNKKKR